MPCKAMLPERWPDGQLVPSGGNNPPQRQVRCPGQTLTGLQAAQVGLGLEPSGLVSAQQKAVGKLAGRLGGIGLCRQPAAG